MNQNGISPTPCRPLSCVIFRKQSTALGTAHKGPMAEAELGHIFRQPVAPKKAKIGSEMAPLSAVTTEARQAT
jgi:hypothetical protein